MTDYPFHRIRRFPTDLLRLYFLGEVETVCCLIPSLLTRYLGPVVLTEERSSYKVCSAVPRCDLRLEILLRKDN